MERHFTFTHFRLLSLLLLPFLFLILPCISFSVRRGRPINSFLCTLSASVVPSKSKNTAGVAIPNDQRQTTKPLRLLLGVELASKEEPTRKNSTQVISIRLECVDTTDFKTWDYSARGSIAFQNNIYRENFLEKITLFLRKDFNILRTCKESPSLLNCSKPF